TARSPLLDVDHPVEPTGSAGAGWAAWRWSEPSRTTISPAVTEPGRRRKREGCVSSLHSIFPMLIVPSLPRDSPKNEPDGQTVQSAAPKDTHNNNCYDS